ncbi:MAG: hypothetical protein IJL89_05920, partial [Firmicutes bacterium]|nr:hypothetical protein [Bacillota bacterium]
MITETDTRLILDFYTVDGIKLVSYYKEKSKEETSEETTETTTETTLHKSGGSSSGGGYSSGGGKSSDKASAVSVKAEETSAKSEISDPESTSNNADKPENKDIVLKIDSTSAVVFGEKYQNPNKTYSISFEFSGARQWQNGTVNYVQKNADGTYALKSDGVQVALNAAWRTYTLNNVYTLGENISGDNFVYLDESGFYIEYPGNDVEDYFLVKNITITEETNAFASAEKNFDTYTIEGIKYAGGEIAPTAGGSVIGVSVRRACDTEPVNKPHLVVAAYDARGTLMGIQKKVITETFTHGGANVVNITLPLTTGVASVKAFMF